MSCKGQSAWVIPRDERQISYPLKKHCLINLTGFETCIGLVCIGLNQSRVIPIMKPSVMKYTQKLAEAFIRLQVKDPVTGNKLLRQLTLWDVNVF